MATVEHPTVSFAAEDQLTKRTHSESAIEVRQIRAKCLATRKREQICATLGGPNGVFSNASSRVKSREAVKAAYQRETSRRESSQSVRETGAGVVGGGGSFNQCGLENTAHARPEPLACVLQRERLHTSAQAASLSCSARLYRA